MYGDDANGTRTVALVLLDLYDAVDRAYLGPVLRHTRFQEVYQPWQTRSDVSMRSGDTTRVENAHAQLRARLANGLPGYHAHCQPHPDWLPGRQVAPVTGAADAEPRLAAERGAHAHSADPAGDQVIRQRLIEQGSGRDAAR